MLFWATHLWNFWAFDSTTEIHSHSHYRLSPNVTLLICSSTGFQNCVTLTEKLTRRKHHSLQNCCAESAQAAGLEGYHSRFGLLHCRNHRKRKYGTAKFKPLVILCYQHPEIYNTAAWKSCLLLSSPIPVTAFCTIGKSTDSFWEDG